MLTDDDRDHAYDRLATILRAHDLDWIVRRVEDALDAGGQPVSGPTADLDLRRLVLLIEATRRALVMSSALERAVPELLLRETEGRWVHIEPDPEGVVDDRLHPRIVIARDPDEDEARQTARELTRAWLDRLLREALDGR